MKKVIFVLILVFLVDINYINNGFVWVDHNDIQERRAILQIKDLPKAFVMPFGETRFYRPIVVITNSIDHLLFKENPSGYHLTNIIIHLFVIVSFYLFLSVFWKMSPNEKLLACLLFGLHPYSSLIIGSIIMRQESLLAGFSLFFIYFYSRARNKELLKDQILSGIFLFLALFTKETALFILPTLIIIWEFTNWSNFKSGIKLWIEESIIGIGYLLLRFKVIPSIWNSPSNTLNLSEWFGTRILVATKFIINFLLPLKPSFADTTYIVPLTDFRVLLIIAVIILAIVAILKSGSKSNLTISSIIFLILLLPAANIVSVPRIASPHYGYLLTIGGIPLVIYFFSKLKILAGKTTNFILIIWLITAGLSVFFTGFQFKNDLTLFTPEVKSNPDFLEGYFYLGNYYFNNHDIQMADKYYLLAQNSRNDAISFVDNRALLVNLAGVRLAQKNFPESEKLLNEALKGATGLTACQITYDLAVIAEAQGNYKKVVNLLKDKLSSCNSPLAKAIYQDALDKISK